MIRRMSKRLARRDAAASSSSLIPWPSSPVPGPRNGICCSDIRCSLDEDDVQDDDERDRAGAEQDGRAPPQAVARVGVVLGGLLLAREAPDEAAELLLGLGLRHERDRDRDDGV